MPDTGLPRPMYYLPDGCPPLPLLPDGFIDWKQQDRLREVRRYISGLYQWPSGARQQSLCQRGDTWLCVGLGAHVIGCPMCMPWDYTGDQLFAAGCRRRDSPTPT